MTDNVYPKVISAEDTEKMLEQRDQDNRIREMLEYQNELNKDLKKYNKIRLKWNKLSKIFDYSGIAILGTLGIASLTVASIATAGIAIPLVAGIALGVGDISGTIYEGLVMMLFEMKKKHIRRKINIVKSYIYRTEHLIEIIRSDKIITLEEIQNFRKLIDEYRNELESVQESKINIEAIKKEIEKKAKKDLKEDLKIRIQNEVASKLQSDVASLYEGTVARRTLEKIPSVRII
jgi:hypothetical protein